jgi:hypothetical protein
MKEYDEQLSPDEIQKIKPQLIDTWQQLPVEHQATMALVILHKVLNSDYGDWMKQALTSTIITDGDRE